MDISSPRPGPPQSGNRQDPQAAGAMSGAAAPWCREPTLKSTILATSGRLHSLDARHTKRFFDSPGHFAYSALQLAVVATTGALISGGFSHEGLLLAFRTCCRNVASGRVVSSPRRFRRHRSQRPQRAGHLRRRILPGISRNCRGLLYFCGLRAHDHRRKDANAQRLAWIPIANVILMIMIAKKPIWWLVLFLIPLVNIVISVIIWMAIAEARRKPSFWGILTIIPVLNLVAIAYLAWS